MNADTLRADELCALKFIAECWVADDYWADETVKRYQELGLVRRAGRRMRLTESGQRTAGLLPLLPDELDRQADAA